MITLEYTGKYQTIGYHNDVSIKEIIIDKKKSFNKKPSYSDNLIIHGDNMDGLKALLPNYANKIKCICIDPPYNTGNVAWIYNDSIDSPLMKSWFKSNVNSRDLNRHDKWACMMYPRLKLLHELLVDDGIIFISIDDNEIATLRHLMNEIFNEKNFVAQLTVIMNYKGNNDEFGFSGTHEYALVYAKNKDKCHVNEFEAGDEITEWKKDEIGLYKKGANLVATGEDGQREKRPNLYFPLYVSKNNKISTEKLNSNDIEVLPITNGVQMRWRWNKSKFNNESHNLIIIRTRDKISIYKKQRPTLGDLPSKKPKTIFYRPEYSSGNGTNLLKAIFGKKVFQNPKPIELIKDFIKIGTGPNDIILDSFAGSGTTAHAVLELNKEYNGNRKFILIEDQPFVDRITAERIRRVIKGIPSSSLKTLKNGLGGTFTYCTLGNSITVEEILSGKNLPSYSSLRSYIIHTITGTSLNEKFNVKKNWSIYETPLDVIFLIYEKDIDFMRSDSSSLNDNLSKIMYRYCKSKNKKGIVFASNTTLSAKILSSRLLTFNQIPFNIRGLH